MFNAIAPQALTLPPPYAEAAAQILPPNVDTTSLREEFNASRLGKEVLDWLAVDSGAPLERHPPCSTVLQAWEREKIRTAVFDKLQRHRSGQTYVIKDGMFRDIF